MDMKWDELCARARPPSALIAANDIALLERSNGELQAKLEEALARVRELEAALEPLAAMAYPSTASNLAINDDFVVFTRATVITLGDVRRARALLGTDAAPAGEGGK